MSTASQSDRDELRPEYDFASMTGGVRGKYAARLRKDGSNLVLLEPEVAQAFPSDAAVNEALRGVLNTTRAVRGKGGLSNKALKAAKRASGQARKRKPRQIRNFRIRLWHIGVGPRPVEQPVRLSDPLCQADQFVSGLDMARRQAQILGRDELGRNRPVLRRKL